MKYVYNFFSIVFALPFALAFVVLYVLSCFFHFCASWIKNRDAHVALYLLGRFLDHGETNIVPKGAVPVQE